MGFLHSCVTSLRIIEQLSILLESDGEVVVSVAPVADVGAVQSGALRKDDWLGEVLLTAGLALVAITVKSESGFVICHVASLALAYSNIIPQLAAACTLDLLIIYRDVRHNVVCAIIDVEHHVCVDHDLTVHVLAKLSSR
jgi:hypothetical protein